MSSFCHTSNHEGLSVTTPPVHEPNPKLKIQTKQHPLVVRIIPINHWPSSRMLLPQPVVLLWCICLTLVFVSTSAPLAIKSSAMAVCPNWHAIYSGVQSSYTKSKVRVHNSYSTACARHQASPESRFSSFTNTR